MISLKLVVPLVDAVPSAYFACTRTGEDPAGGVLQPCAC